MNRRLVISSSLIVMALAGLWVYSRFNGSVINTDNSAELFNKEKIYLYYYNPDKDRDMEGNIQCSRDGLVRVDRWILSNDLIKDTVQLLLKGELNDSERLRGISTEYPMPGFELRDYKLENGKLTLYFNDSQNLSVGGACRVGILWFQIEATAKQFPEVKEVKFMPEEIFQP